nr:MAG TPA: hypothetical protein [Caudoviricetes sp.]
MCVIYETKVYDIGIDHCLYWGMQHGFVYSMHICVAWVYWCEKYAAWVCYDITAPS